MNEININQETGLLDEFSVVKPPKSKLFDVLTSFLFIYIAFALTSLVVDVNTLSLRQFSWQAAIVILLLPFFGVIFHLTGRKIGWIINCFYYLFITSVLFYVLLQGLFEERDISTLTANWRGISFFILTLAPTVLLFSKPMKKYFRVSRLLFIIMIVVPVSFAILFAWLMYYYRNG